MELSNEHTTSAPYHPSLNGLAECTVQIAIREIDMWQHEHHTGKGPFHLQLQTTQSTIGIRLCQTSIYFPVNSRIRLLLMHYNTIHILHTTYGNTRLYRAPRVMHFSAFIFLYNIQ